MRLPGNRATIAPMSRLDSILLGIALLAAAVTRLTYTDLAEFKDDEARALGIAAAFLEGKMIPLIGIVSSVGINNPPAFVYLLTIPLLISRNPAVATGFIGLLGVAAVFVTYRVCDRYFDRATAQVAALLFASSPWAIIFGRKLQAQDVVPFFVILWLGSLLAFASGRGPRHLLGVALWLNILVQLHLASVALIPVTGIVLATSFWRQRHASGLRRGAAEAVGLTVLLWVPFIIFQFTHNLADVHAFLHVMRQPPTIELESFKLIYEMVYLNAYNGMTGLGYEQYHAQTLSFDLLYEAERLLFFAGVTWLAVRLAYSRGRAASDWRDGILLLWLIIPPLFFVRHSTPIYPHYFLTVFPAQFIIIGRLFSDLGRGLAPRPAPVKRAITGLGVVLIGALVVSQVYGLVSLMDFVARASTLGSHGVPLRERQAAVDRAVAATAGSAKPVYVASNGQDYPASFEYLAHNRISLKVFDDRNTFVAPADDGIPTVYLTTDPNQPAAQLLHDRFGDRHVDTIPWPGQTTGFDVYLLPSNAGAQILHPPTLRPLEASLSNGMQLAGYEVGREAQAGGSTRLALYWHVVGAPPLGEDYAFFSHLVDDTGHVWGQQDGLGYPPYFWRFGDSVVSWFDLPVSNDAPATSGEIETGMYRRSDTGRLPLRLADGTTVDRLLLGPLRLVPRSATPIVPPAIAQLTHFGTFVDLLGFDLHEPISSTDPIKVTLSWHSKAPLDADYSTFVHLLDDRNQIVGQSDGQPGPYPTSLWVDGDTIRDERTISLVKSLAPGIYRLAVGLYRADTLARLPTSDGDQVFLSKAVVVP